MSNRIVSTSSRVFLALLAASAIAMAGCDNPSSPALPTYATGSSILDPSDNGRQRDDPARGRVWVVNSHGVFLYHAGTGKLVEVTCRMAVGGGPYACADLALGPTAKRSSPATSCRYCG